MLASGVELAAVLVALVCRRDGHREGVEVEALEGRKGLFRGMEPRQVMVIKQNIAVCRAYRFLERAAGSTIRGFCVRRAIYERRSSSSSSTSPSHLTERTRKPKSRSRAGARFQDRGRPEISPIRDRPFTHSPCSSLQTAGSKERSCPHAAFHGTSGLPTRGSAAVGSPPCPVEVHRLGHSPRSDIFGFGEHPESFRTFG